MKVHNSGKPGGREYNKRWLSECRDLITAATRIFSGYCAAEQLTCQPTSEAAGVDENWPPDGLGFVSGAAPPSSADPAELSGAESLGAASEAYADRPASELVGMWVEMPGSAWADDQWDVAEGDDTDTLRAAREAWYPGQIVGVLPPEATSNFCSRSGRREEWFEVDFTYDGVFPVTLGAVHKHLHTPVKKFVLSRSQS